MTEAVIMAGGKGTRVQSVADLLPKPMIPILGKPVLEYQIEALKKNGIYKIKIVVGHLKEVIINYLGDGTKFGVKIEYIEETSPLGTGGALYYLKEQNDDFLLVFGDIIFDVDLKRFYSFHKQKESDITLFVHPNQHPFDSDIVEADNNGSVTKIYRKNIERNFYYHNLVNAGIYFVNPRALVFIDQPQKIDFDKDIVQKLIPSGKIFAYKSPEYVKDMGTPDRINLVESDIKKGIPSARNLSIRQKAIFLDRDGTINKLKGFLTDIDQFELENNAAEGIAAINSSQHLSIVITNQPVIARGELSFSGLDEIHKKMETLLGQKKAYVDDIFYCPHHPDKGYEGELSDLKIKCECRKPGIELILKATEKYNIDLTRSWFIGDTTSDIQTGINAGMRTVLVKTGMSGRDCKYLVEPDIQEKDLLSAAKRIL